MFGYPDETMEQVMATFNLAREHMEAGLTNANFMYVTPFPGTPFHDTVIKRGLFLPGVVIADLDWTSLSIHTQVPKEFLDNIMTEGWKSINTPERVGRMHELATV